MSFFVTLPVSDVNFMRYKPVFNWLVLICLDLDVKFCFIIDLPSISKISMLRGMLDSIVSKSSFNGFG